MGGWYKYPRSELESDIWLMPPLHTRVWLWLQLKVNHTEVEYMFPSGEKIKIKPGQHCTSLRKIANGVAWADRSGIHEPNVKTIKDILKWLEKNNLISVNHGKGNSQYTLVTILNKDFFQNISKESNAKVNTEETEKKRLLDINKKEENEKNDKNLSTSSGESENKDEIPLSPLVDEDTKSIVDSLISNQIIRPTALNATISDDIDYYLTKLRSKGEAKEIILYAISEAARRNAKSWKYVETILNTWTSEGFNDLESIKNFNEVKTYATYPRGIKQSNKPTREYQSNMDPAINW